MFPFPLTLFELNLFLHVVFFFFLSVLHYVYGWSVTIHSQHHSLGCFASSVKPFELAVFLDNILLS